MHNPPDYEGIEQKLWGKNTTEAVSRFNEQDRYILRKIRTYTWRFGFSEEEVRQHIRADKMFAAWFAKGPRCQGIHEKIATDWPEEEELIENFQCLPQSGEDAWCIATDGELRRWKRPKGVKSLDFVGQPESTLCMLHVNKEVWRKPRSVT